MRLLSFTFTFTFLKSKLSKAKLRLKLKLKKERSFSHVERMLDGIPPCVDSVMPSRFSYMSVIMEESDEVEDDDYVMDWIGDDDVDIDVDEFWSLDGHLVEDWFNAEWA